MQLHRQPQALGKHRFEPAARRRVIERIGHPQRQQPRQRHVEVTAQNLILALLRASPRLGDQSAQVLIAFEVFHQQHQFRAIFDPYFAADNQRQCHGLGRLPRTNDARQRAFVGDRQGLVAVLFRALEQLQGAGRTALETEAGQAMQLGIIGAHANQPCNHNGPSSPTDR
ncbi:hypothetical protein D3C73_1129430 [compost metagenome]